MSGLIFKHPRRSSSKYWSVLGIPGVKCGALMHVIGAACPGVTSAARRSVFKCTYLEVLGLWNDRTFDVNAY